MCMDYVYSHQLNNFIVATNSEFRAIYYLDIWKDSVIKKQLLDSAFIQLTTHKKIQQREGHRGHQPMWSAISPFLQYPIQFLC